MDFFPKGNVLFAYGKFSSVLLGIGGFQFAGGGKNVCMMLYGWCFLWCMVGLPVFPLEVIFQQVVWLNVFCFHFARARLDPTMCDKWFGKHEMKSGHVDIQNVCKSGHVDIQNVYKYEEHLVHKCGYRKDISRNIYIYIYIYIYTSLNVYTYKQAEDKNVV